MRKGIFLIAALLGALAFSEAYAVPVQWTTNNHYYEAIGDNATITWDQATALAESSYHLGAQGYLATITSQAENDFIWSLGGPAYHFLGGFQPAGSAEPSGGWQWITSEPWAYTNWNSPPEPNNTSNIEDVVQLWTNGKWNDVDRGFFHASKYYKGYIVEYDYIIPEPTSMLLLGIGLIGFAGARIRKRFKEV